MRTFRLCLLLTAAILLVPAAAWACSCMATTIFNDFNRADAAFVARVDSIDRPSMYQLDVSAEVLHAWKGTSVGPVVIHTSGDSAACGYPFDPGYTYLVFAYADEDDPGALWATLCSSTQPVLDVAEAERLLVDAGIDPTVASPPDTEPEPEGEEGGVPDGRRWPWARFDSLDIRRSNARTLTDLVWPVSGVFPLRISRATTGVSARGLAGRHVQVLLDGFPLRSALVGDRLDPQEGLLDLHSLEAVWVVPGLDPAAWGPGALGGTVGLESRRSVHLGSPGIRMQNAARFDSADLAADASVRLDAGFGPAAVVAGMHGLYANDLNPGSPLEDVPTSFNQFGGDVGVFVPDGSGHLTARWLAARQQTFLDDDPEVLAREIVSRNRHLAWLGWVQRDLGPALQLLDLRGAYLGQGEETPIAFGVARTERVHRALFRGRAESPLSERTVLAWGADVDFELLKTSGPDATRAGSVPLRDGATHLTAAAVTELRWQAGSRTALGVAGRAGWVRGDTPDEGEAGAELSAFSGSATLRLDQVLAPNLLQVRLALATGTGEPNLTDLAGLERTTEGTFLPNSGLHSEQAWGGEAGAWLMLDPFEITLTGHAQWLFDTLRLRSTGLFDPENPDASGAPRPFLETVNSGEARIYGLESTLAMLLGDFRAFASVAWARGDDLVTRRSLPTVPPVNGTFGVAYTRPTWGASAYTRYALEADNVASDEATTPGFAIFGIRADYRWASWGGAVLTVDNLAGQAYRAHGSLVPEPGLQVVGALHFQIGDS